MPAISNKWVDDVKRIGSCIEEAAAVHPEIMPLYASFQNFAKKNGIEIQQLDSVVRLRNIISKQNDEIAALEYRVSTLLGDKS